MSKPIRWDEAKSEQLRQRYGIGFEEIIVAFDSGALLDDRAHPNQERYGHQNQFVVEIDSYAYVVPYVEDGDHFFLKTLFPCRKSTRQYLINLKSS